ncbi:hypothetical protein QT971_18240 [Microcoleus sp. herbarium19]|uniref:hypothetical protein n=1 Tax=unclassified Microcoleus TaxID=2642155 RepID=UPI002FD50585
MVCYVTILRNQLGSTHLKNVSIREDFDINEMDMLDRTLIYKKSRSPIAAESGVCAASPDRL